MSSYKTFSTEAADALREEEAAEHLAEMKGVLDELTDLWKSKGYDYNQLTTFMENMPFGDMSWGTLCWIKAHRAASLVMKGLTGEIPVYDTLNEVLLDLIVYAAGWIAFRRLRHRESAQVEEMKFHG